MYLSHEQIQRRLKKLEANLPAMMREHPDSADFNEVFVAQADAITDNASGEDYAWAFGEVDRMLEKFDLWHPGVAQQHFASPPQAQPADSGSASVSRQ